MYVEAKLAHVHNVYVSRGDAQFDASLDVMDIRGNVYALVHGEYDSNSEVG